MALTEQTEIAKIELVGPERDMQIRVDRVIYDDGVEIARSHSRRVIPTDAPDDPAEIQEIRDLRAVAHTPERRAAKAQQREAAQGQGRGQGQ